MLVCLASKNRRGKAGSTPPYKNGADQNQDKEHDLRHTALNRSRFQDAASNDLRGVPSDIIKYCNHGLRESKIRILCSKAKNYFKKKLHNYHKNNKNNNKNRQLNFKKKKMLSSWVQVKTITGQKIKNRQLPSNYICPTASVQTLVVHLQSALHMQ